MRRLAILLSLVALGCAASGPRRSKRPLPAIPPHPSKIVFERLDYRPPDYRDYMADIRSVPAFVAEDHEVPLLDITLIFPTGRYMDPEGREGLASFTGDLMREGGFGDMYPAEVDEEIAFMAARLSVDVGFQTTRVGLSVLSKDADEGVRLMIQMLTRPLFDEGRLRLRREEVLKELQARNDRTGSIERREVTRLLYRDHPRARLRTKASVESIDVDAMRTFHRELIDPDGMVIAAAGALERGRIESLLLQIVERLRVARGGEVDVVEAAFTGAPDVEGEPEPGVYMIHKEGVSQGRVTMAHLSIPYDHPDRIPLLLLNQILGGGSLTSRIGSKVRSEEGLAYSVGTSIQPEDRYRGRFAASFQSKSETCARAAVLTLAEIERIREEPVTREELVRARTSFIESFPNTFRSPLGTCEIFAEDVVMGRPLDRYATLQERLRAVTVDDLLRVAREHLRPEKLVCVVVGDLGAIRAGEGIGGRFTDLGLGEPKELALPDPMTLER